MTARPVGRWYRVGQILSLIEQMGCEVRLLPSQLLDDDGHPVSVRYVLNHETGRFVTLTDLSDDDRIPEHEVATWTRRLGIEIPLPPIA